MSTGKRTQASRQQPGLACEACRSKKLRCDREQPQCGTCRAANIACVIDFDRLPRGRKGNVKSLQAKIVSLTRRLADIEDQQNELTSTGNTDETQFNNMNGTLFDNRAQQDMGSNSHSSLDLSVEKPERRPLGRQETSVVAPALPYDTSLDQFINGQDLSAQPVQSLNDIERPDSGIEPGLFEHLFLPSLSNLCPDPNLTTFDTQGRLTATGDNESLKRSSSSLDLTDLICADLDHLYFDRVHPFVPFLNQYRYFLQARQGIDDALVPTRALRHAMWTLAASFSTQFQHIQKSLYSQTKMILEELDSTATFRPMTIQEVQARTLLIMYEIMHMDFRTAWISAGNCLRLALLLRLHEIDLLGTGGRKDLNWSEIEEQRSTFWTVFILDCFMNLINEAPFRIDEETILTRLPAPEVNCLTSPPIETPFIWEVMSGQRQVPSSHFVDIIIVLAISGRCEIHKRRSLAENVNRTESTAAFWSRHQAINMLLSRKDGLSSMQRAHDSVQADSMSLLSNMMTHALVLTMYKLIESTNLDSTQNRSIIDEYEQSALNAAKAITELSRVLPSLCYFKVHPFTPFPMAICVEFLLSRRSVHEPASLEVDAGEVWRELQSICLVNNLARICSSKLQTVNQCVKIDT